MSAVLQVIAQKYRSGRAGKHAEATRGLVFNFHKLMEDAKCLAGPERYEAIRDLETLESKGVLLIKRHRTDPTAILQIRLPLQNASALFDYLGETAPQRDREALAEKFRAAEGSTVPKVYESAWKQFCERYAVATEVGDSIQPFDRAKPRQIEIVLQALPAVLAWEGESLIRFASSTIFGHSKMLEKYRGQMEACLTQLSDGKVTKLADIGILENERSFLVHGPIRLVYVDGEINLHCLELPARIGVKDIRRAELITPATRCLTVENAAMLIELAKLRSDVVLVSSGSEGGYANTATVEFLKSLPGDMELWHFGDSDPKGFDILRDLRQRTGRLIRSLHMCFRTDAIFSPLSHEDLETIERLTESEYLTESEKVDLSRTKACNSKGAFEQESLGRPKILTWPFY